MFEISARASNQVTRELGPITNDIMGKRQGTAADGGSVADGSVGTDGRVGQDAGVCVCSRVVTGVSTRLPGVLSGAGRGRYRTIT